MAQYVFTMNRVGKIVPPKRQILKDICHRIVGVEEDVCVGVLDEVIVGVLLGVNVAVIVAVLLPDGIAVHCPRTPYRREKAARRRTVLIASAVAASVLLVSVGVGFALLAHRPARTPVPPPRPLPPTCRTTRKWRCSAPCSRAKARTALGPASMPP